MEAPSEKTPSTATMTDSEIAPSVDDNNNNDAMKSSANALTKKLYLTVMDVFGNYVGNDEDDYDDMIETLRRKQLAAKQKNENPQKKQNAVTTATKDPMSDADLAFASTTQSTHSDCTEDDDPEEFVNREMSQCNERRSRATDAYASKILDGYVIQGALCRRCDLPMMKYDDRIECIFCQPKEAAAAASAAAANQVTVMEESEPALEAAKTDIVVGYDQAPPEEKPARELSRAEILAERLRGGGVNGASETTERKIEKAESELMKMMEALGTQGNQNDSLQTYFTRKKEDRAAVKSLEEAEAGILEAEEIAARDQRNCMDADILQALQVEIVPENATCGGGGGHGGDHGGDHGDDHGGGLEKNGVGVLNPPTPQFASSAGCTFDGFFPSLKKMFASAGPTTGADEVGITTMLLPERQQQYEVNNSHHHQHHRATTKPNRIEAKKRIGMLVAEGWEVSADSCPHCVLPLFSNSNIVGQKALGAVVGNGTKCCVMCGPIVEKGVSKNGVGVGVQQPQGNADLQLNNNKETHEDITKKMVNRITEGWSIVEGTRCPDCTIPIMFDPKTGLTHCIACPERVVLLEQQPIMQQQQLPAVEQPDKYAVSSDPASSAPVINEEAQADIAQEMVNRIMAGWVVVEGHQCPTCYMPTMFDPSTTLTHCVACDLINVPAADDATATAPRVAFTENVESSSNAATTTTTTTTTTSQKSQPPSRMRAMKNKLKLDIDNDEAPAVAEKLPDPTVSMYEFRGQYQGHGSEPTPNMQAVRNKMLQQASVLQTEPAEVSYSNGYNKPACAMQLEPVHYTRYTEPTPNVQAVRNKMLQQQQQQASAAQQTGYNDPASTIQLEPVHYTRYTEPTPNMQAVRNKMLQQQASTTAQQTGRNDPASTMQLEPVHYTRYTEPTPNMQAVRNKVYAAAAQTQPYEPCDPTPSMQTVRGKLMNNPPPTTTQSQDFGNDHLFILTKDEQQQQPSATHVIQSPELRTHRHKRNEPTPNMQALRHKLSELELNPQQLLNNPETMYAMQQQKQQQEVNTIHASSVSSSSSSAGNYAVTRAMEPTPSNSHFRTKGPMEAPGY